MTFNQPITEDVIVDRAAIFSGILDRNAIRREALLPSLDVSAEYHRKVQHALWRAHYDRNYAPTRAAVLAQLRSEYGDDFPDSAGGEMALRIKVRKALQTNLDRDLAGAPRRRL